MLDAPEKLLIADTITGARWRTLYFTKTGYSELCGPFYRSEDEACEKIKAFFAEWQDYVAEYGDDTVEFPSGFEILFSLISHAIPIPIID